jgi:hypothetical protein
LDADLMWLEGIDAISNDIYFGTDPENLPFIRNQSNNIFTPPALSPGVTYYWRIDTVTTNGTVRGETWSFTPIPPFIEEWVTLHPVEDTGVDSSLPDTNFADAQTVGIRTSITGGIEKEAYLKFYVDVPGQVRSASLELYHDAPSNVDGVQVWSMSDTSWKAGEMTWHNRPPIDGVLLDSNQINSQRWRKFDVTPAIRNGWIAFAIDRRPSDSNRSIPLSESSYSPRLHIEYEAEPVNPTAYQSWEYRHGILGWGRGIDLDGDDLDNAFEYLFGTDPVDPANPELPAVIVAAVDGRQYPAIQYSYRNDGSVTSYVVEASGNLGNWTPRIVSPTVDQLTEVGPPETDGDYSRATLRYNTPMEELPGGRLFLRVKATE